MLRVCGLSGAEVAAIPVEEGMGTVQSLKEELRRLHGFPVSLQSILHDGDCLRDVDELREPVDLMLVLETLASTEQQAEHLVAAVVCGHVPEVQWMLRQTEDLNCANRSGYVALPTACSRNHVEIVRLLLEARANTDKRDKRGYTPLGAAARLGHLEVAQLLLAAGADKDARDFRCYTPLYAAAATGHVEIVRLLLENRADSDKTRAWDQDSPLCAACRLNSAAIVRLLLEAKCNTEIIDSHERRTPLGMAAHRNQPEVLCLLLEAGADKVDSYACRPTVRLLLR